MVKVKVQNTNRETGHSGDTAKFVFTEMFDMVRKTMFYLGFMSHSDKENSLAPGVTPLGIETLDDLSLGVRLSLDGGGGGGGPPLPGGGGGGN